MANTITVSLQLSVALAAGGAVSGVGSQVLTQAGAYNQGEVVNLSTSDQTLSLGGVTVPCMIMIKNLDATNYVEIDSGSAYTSFPQKIQPGGFILLAPETVTIHAKAHTAACDCLIVAIDL